MADLPESKKWLVDGFRWYSRRLLRKNFHAWYLDAAHLAELELTPTNPIIVYANHPSWWDPIVAMLLCERLFPDRCFYAPIDAAALENYQIMESLGFYGLDLSSRNGAVSFLQTSSKIVQSPNATLWITPEGQFTDSRDYRVKFQPGLAHLVHKMLRKTTMPAESEPVILPLALEYPFWNERQPVVLSGFGSPVNLSELVESKAACQNLLEERLRETQKALAATATNRTAGKYEHVLLSRSGNRTAYDVFRQIKSLLMGRKFQQSHAVDRN